MTIEQHKAAAAEFAKPCPFRATHGVKERPPQIEQDEDDFQFWVVTCGCGARGPWFRSSDIIQGCAGAVQFWNDRE